MGWHVQFSQEQDVTTGTPTAPRLCGVIKNHLKRGMMKSEVTNCYIDAFYMKNPILAP